MAAAAALDITSLADEVARAVAAARRARSRSSSCLDSCLASMAAAAALDVTSLADEVALAGTDSTASVTGSRRPAVDTTAGRFTHQGRHSKKRRVKRRT